MSVELNPIKDLVKGGIEGIGKTFSEIVSRFKADPTKVLECQAELEKAAQETTLKASEIANEAARIANQREEAYLKDLANARAMQIEALKQADKFSKHFVYYLSAFMVLGAFAFGVFLVYVEIPEGNKRMVEMFVDIFLFAGALMVLQFFLGSSASSKEKSKQIEGMIK